MAKSSEVVGVDGLDLQPPLRQLEIVSGEKEAIERAREILDSQSGLAPLEHCSVIRLDYLGRDAKETQREVYRLVGTIEKIKAPTSKTQKNSNSRLRTKKI